MNNIDRMIRVFIVQYRACETEESRDTIISLVFAMANSFFGEERSPERSRVINLFMNNI